MRRNRIIFFIPFLFLFSCSFFDGFNFYYRTYSHPSLPFSISYPKLWELEEGGRFGTQVIFLSNNKDEVFRANANIVFSNADLKNLDKLSQLSIQQLKLILNQYDLIAQNKKKLGNLEGFELRGKYTAQEGIRIIRTVVAIDKDVQYVFTFTASAEKENNYTQTVNHMIQSFHLKK